MLPRVIVWLVRDTCRVNDNPALRLACLNSKSEGAGVVPLACLEPRRWHSHQMGLPRIGVQWMKFRLESLEVLRHGLEELGSAIWVSEEEPIDAIVGLSRRFSILRVITDNPLSTEERFENAQIKDGGFDVVTMTTDDLFDVSQLPFEMADLPDTFSKFRRSIEKNSTIEPPSCCACPNIPSVEKYA